MVNDAVNGGRGKGIVVIKDFPPVTECPVRDDLKEEFGLLLSRGRKPSSSRMSSRGDVKVFMTFRKELSAREADN